MFWFCVCFINNFDLLISTIIIKQIFFSFLSTPTIRSRSYYFYSRTPFNTITSITPKYTLSVFMFKIITIRFIMFSIFLFPFFCIYVSIACCHRAWLSPNGSLKFGFGLLVPFDKIARRLTTKSNLISHSLHQAKMP